MKQLITFALVSLLSSTLAYAQIEKNNFNNNKVIPAKINKQDSLKKAQDSLRNSVLQFKVPDEEPSQTPDKADTDGMADVGFKVQKSLTIVSRDPLFAEIGKKQLVRISEELYIDSVWVKAAEYYRVWDSNNINPYGKNAALFKDTVTLRLYNLPAGEYWSAPMEKNLQTSGFGYRWGSFHHGVDLDLKMGTPVATAFDGIVRISTFGHGYGNYVVVRHKNGIETLYGHFSKRAVETGQVVKAGQIIGYGGSTGWSTGPHLHLETHYEGHSINPLLIFDFSKQQIVINEYFTVMPHHFAHLGNKVRQIPMHTVTQGETLTIIGARYGIPVDMLAKINNLTASSELKVGQGIKLK